MLDQVVNEIPVSPQHSASPNGRRRSGESKAQAARLEKIFGVDLVAGLGRTERAARSGTIRFLTWLVAQTDNPLAVKIREAFWRGPEEVFREHGANSWEVSHGRVFFDLFSRWCREWEANPEGLSQDTVLRQCRKSAVHLESLAAHIPGIPTSFRASIRFGRAKNRAITPSLGDADWSELSSFKGIERERKALQLVRDECCRAFLEEEYNFHRARTILRGEIPDGADENMCRLAREIFLCAEEIIRNEGRVGETALRVKLGTRRGHIEIWRKVGLHGQTAKSLSRRAALFPFMPTSRMTAAAIGIYICDTGWNVQPTLDLAADPVLFSTPNQSYLAAPVFVEAFKKRAGHYVLAYLGEGNSLSGARLETAAQIWRDTIDQDGSSQDQHHAVLDRRAAPNTLTALDVLGRYRVVADEYRGLLGARKIDGPPPSVLWKYNSAHPPGLDRAQIRFHGATYRSIRKTVQLIRWEDSGSMRAVARSAGQTGTAVIMPHYLNAPHVNAKLDQSIRDFQNAMQGVVVRDLEQESVAEILGISVGTLEAARRHAQRAGIAAVLGLNSRRDESRERFVIPFSPQDPVSLERLYLVHRSLRELQRYARNHARFHLRFMPMLAIAKAIGREVSRTGFGRAYLYAARSANKKLRAGEIELPFLGEC